MTEHDFQREAGFCAECGGQKNVYQMYQKHRKFGFWVRRNTWGTVIAKIVGIRGVVEGKSISGKGPYYGVKGKGSPFVYAEFYRGFSRPEKYLNRGTLSCPGTYAYKHIVIDTPEPGETV
jgi:hypothetical protein